MLIAITTPLFPRAGEPYRGWPIYKTVEALEKHADVRVFSAAAKYPNDKTVPAPSPESKIRHSETYISYPAIPLLSRPWNSAVCAGRLYPHLQRLRPDVILSYWLYPEGAAALEVGRRLGLPVIVGSRGSDLRRIGDPVTGMMVARTVRNADHVLTVSEELRQRAIRLGADPGRTTAILNGYDPLPFFCGDMHEARRNLGLPADGRLVLCVGRLSRQKGLQELCDAFAVLAREHSNLKLVFLGSGAFGQRILSLARQWRLEDRIVTRGDVGRNSVAEWMRAADLLCLPSYSEGCPNVVIEAIACGCPVVASEVGGIPEIVSPESSILVPPRNSGALAAALSTALVRRWDRRRISGTYTRTWDEVASDTYAVCEKVAKPSAAGKRIGYRSRPLRITVVSSYFPISANSYRGHSAFHTLEELKKMAEVTVICPMGGNPAGRWLPGGGSEAPDPKFQPDDMRVTFLPYPKLPLLTRPVNGFTCKRRLLPLLRATAPDVVLNYWLYPEGYAAVKAGGVLGAPVVVGSIGSDLRQIKDPFTAYFVKQTLLESAAVITVSEDLRRHALAMGAPAEKVFAIPNGYDASVFHYGDRDSERRSLACEAGSELILYVGNLLQSKGLGELADGFAALLKCRPAARLAVIGEGGYRRAFEGRLAAQKVRERVLILGRQPSQAVASWMRAADLLCLPSYSEGCPNVVMEAIGCGCPVVATSVGGIPEVVDEGNGILALPRDSAGLCRALEAGLCRRWDRPGIAGKSRRGWDAVAEEVFTVCSDAANRRIPAAARFREPRND